MQPKILTDDELHAAMEDALQGYVRGAQKVRAHIAALAAERDEVVQEAKADGEDFGFRQATECIGGRSYSATCSMGALAAARAVADEMTALRERVQALQKDVRELTEHRDELREKWTAAERRYERQHDRAEAAENRPPEQEEVSDEVDCDLDGKGRQVLAATYCEEHGASAGECAGSHPEPSTAEAFATLRRFNGRHDIQCGSIIGPVPCDCGAEQRLSTLALLERRMGAVTRALRTPTVPVTVALDVYEKARRYDRAFHALTDAPRVFTPEDLNAISDEDLGQMYVGAAGVFGLGTSWATMTDAMRKLYGQAGRTFRQYLAEHLAALRK